MAGITVQSLLGTKLPKITRASARKLNSKVRRARVKCIAKLKKLFKAHAIYGRLPEIDKTTQYPISVEAANALEAIDKLVANLMHQAEKGYREL